MYVYVCVCCLRQMRLVFLSARGARRESAGGRGAMPRSRDAAARNNGLVALGITVRKSEGKRETDEDMVRESLCVRE